MRYHCRVFIIFYLEKWISRWANHTRNVFSPLKTFEEARGSCGVSPGCYWSWMSMVVKACLLNRRLSPSTSSSSVLCIEGLRIFASKSNWRNICWCNFNYSFYKNVKWMHKLFLSSRIPLWVLCLVTHGLLALVSLILWCQLVDECL